MKKNAATRRHPSELRQGSASGRGTDAARWPRSTRVAPGSKPAREWHRACGRQRRTDIDSGCVDAGREHRTVGEALFHADGKKGVAESHADSHRDRQQDEQRRSRHERPRDPEGADQRERCRERLA
jgi:hypothetical protein